MNRGNKSVGPVAVVIASVVGGLKPIRAIGGLLHALVHTNFKWVVIRGNPRGGEKVLCASLKVGFTYACPVPLYFHHRNSLSVAPFGADDM